MAPNRQEKTHGCGVVVHTVVMELGVEVAQGRMLPVYEKGVQVRRP